MKNPKFSVIIPAHNEESVIKKAVESIFKQTFKDFEIIVVNDGSTDRTREIVEGLMKKHKQIKLINYEQGHSAAFSRNRGAENANGEILLFLDSDTYINERFLEEVNKYSDKADAFITLNYPLKNNFMSKTLSMFLGPPKKAHLKDGSVYTKENKDEAGSMFFCISKKAYDRINGYDEKIFYFEDEDFSNKFWENNFKAVFVKGANQYFELPATFSEFIRQCKWISKGINSIKDRRERRRNKLIWFAKSLFLLSPFLFVWNVKYFLAAFIITLSISYIGIMLRSKKPFGSFTALPLLYIKTLLVSLNLIRFSGKNER